MSPRQSRQQPQNTDSFCFWAEGKKLNVLENTISQQEVEGLVLEHFVEENKREVCCWKIYYFRVEPNRNLSR